MNTYIITFQVLNRDECEKLGLSEICGEVTIGFEEQQWCTSLRWIHGLPLFDKQWNWFVDDAKIKVGDTIAFLRTDDTFRYKVYVYEKSVFPSHDSSSGMKKVLHLSLQSAFVLAVVFAGGCRYRKFFKLVTDHTLEFGELVCFFLLFSNWYEKITIIKIY